MRKTVNALVVVLILVLGFGIGAGFVVKVREAANRMSCANHLKVIGLSTEHYREVNGSYPPGAFPDEHLPLEKRRSWYFEVFPYIESRMDVNWHEGRTKAWDAVENRSIVNGPHGLFLCPSVHTPAREDLPGLTHYVGIAGVGLEAPTLPKEDPKAGILGYDRRTRRNDIKDGLGNTVIVVETAWENGPWAAGGFATVRGLDPGQQPYMGRGRPFGGLHCGGVNLLFADASVRFLKDSLAPQTFEALATIAGGEEIEPFESSDAPEQEAR